MKREELARAIGNNLVMLRGIRTRRGVAKEIGIGYSTLSNYENGLRIPPDDMKMRIAEYYQKPVQEIFYPREYYNMT